MLKSEEINNLLKKGYLTGCEYSLVFPKEYLSDKVNENNNKMLRDKSKEISI